MSEKNKNSCCKHCGFDLGSMTTRLDRQIIYEVCPRCGANLENPITVGMTTEGNDSPTRRIKLNG